MAKGFRRQHEENPFPFKKPIILDVDTILTICRLSKSAIAMIEYLNKNGCIYEDKFMIPLNEYLKNTGFKSKKSYYVGIDELIRFDVIAKTQDMNFFYLNPKFFPKYVGV